MAIDSYMVFVPYQGDPFASESQVDFSSNSEDLAAPFKSNKGKVFEVTDFSFGIEQVLNIGSQSTGAGAGKVTFNPFSITRSIDCSSPKFFTASCAGTPFKTVALGLRKSSGQASAGTFFLRFDFKLVAVKTINWAHDDESPKETIEFEYGGLQVRYTQQKPDGSMAAAIVGGWNRVKNLQDLADYGSNPIS